MPYEFDIVETMHTIDHGPEDRGHRDSSWRPLTAPMDARSAEGWELVDVSVHIVASQNRYGRPQKLRTVVSVWRRPMTGESTPPAEPAA